MFKLAIKLTIEDYSEKSLAVFGDVDNPLVREAFTKAKGLENEHLKGNRHGWIFSKFKKNEITKMVNDLCKGSYVSSNPFGGGSSGGSGSSSCGSSTGSDKKIIDMFNMLKTDISKLIATQTKIEAFLSEYSDGKYQEFLKTLEGDRESGDPRDSRDSKEAASESDGEDEAPKRLLAAKPEVKAESKAVPKPESKAMPKPESKPVSRLIASKPAVKPEIKNAVKPSVSTHK